MAFSAFLLATTTADQAGAIELSSNDQIFGRLSAPMNSVVDGLPFRTAIHSIAKEAGVNVWLDRMVDPSIAVSGGPVGPSVYLALDRLAQSQDCVIMPIAGVVLVGRADWVARTASAIAALDLDDAAMEVDLRWDDLTSPIEALCIAAGTDVKIQPALPHDLWPETVWRSIDRRLAVALIAAQCNRGLRSMTGLTNLQTDVLAAAEPMTCRYHLDESMELFRREFMAADANATVRRTTTGWQARGVPQAHRIAIGSVFASLAPQLPDPDQAIFTIKQMRTSAANAFQQLAAMSGRSCRIDPDVLPLCKQIVSVAGQDLSLRQLTQLVADEIDVLVHWEESTIHITAGKAVTESNRP